MSFPLTDDISCNVKALIRQVTGLKEQTSPFNALEKRLITTLKKADTMYFLNSKDVQKEIDGMAEKFRFHGFFTHAKRLLSTYEQYITTNKSESDLIIKLNIIKFLLCLSQSPTTHFWEHPEQFQFVNETPSEKNEEIDWAKYLQQDLEKWRIPHNDSSEESDYEGGDYDQESLESSIAMASSVGNPVIPMEKELELYDINERKEQLLNQIQHTWFNEKRIVFKPPSDWFQANVAILWDKFVQDQTHGLLEMAPLNILSEYKVIREILWQMFGVHESTVFQFSGNNLIVRPHITIASIRVEAFESYLDKVFLPYILLLDEFNKFFAHQPLEGAPAIYSTYKMAVKSILNPIYQQLIVIQNEVRQQENTFTLLMLAEKFELFKEQLWLLHDLHLDLVQDFNITSPRVWSINVLIRLRQKLRNCTSKIDQDLKLALYLECLYCYFGFVDNWLVKNDLSDCNNEFVIVQNQLPFDSGVKLVNVPLEGRICFVISNECQDFYGQDGIIDLILNDVLEIGKNLYLLRLLQPFNVIPDCEETIYEEFLRKFIQKLCQHYNCNEQSFEATSQIVDKVTTKEAKFLEFVDTSNGFLMKAFDAFNTDLEETQPEMELSRKPTIYERISEITTNLFPLQRIPEELFREILKSRFTISGVIVKTLLNEKYGLGKLFEFFRHVFLFYDDVIFPFYRRLFKNMTSGMPFWGNTVWLTSHLQDILLDCYPQFYQDLYVKVRTDWRQCNDSLTACSLINLDYNLKWPLITIVTTDHLVLYQELFQIILKLKWALYTLNHLDFNDLDVKGEVKHTQLSIKRLNCLRFSLSNLFNTLQHYIFGQIFVRYLHEFEIEFEKSNDLKSMVKSHDNFINSIYKEVKRICQDGSSDGKKYKFNTLLSVVRVLKYLWAHPEVSTATRLLDCQKQYLQCFEAINSLIYPLPLFDYN